MKLITAFLLYLAFLLFTIKPFIPYINYALNRQYIIHEYCINKDKPEMHCNGKCYLKKQLKEAFKQEQEEQGDYHNIPKNLHEPDNYLLFGLTDFYQKNNIVTLLRIYSKCLKSIYYLSPPDPPPKSMV